MTPQAAASPQKTKSLPDTLGRFFRESRFIRVLLFLILLAACFYVTLKTNDIYVYKEGKKALRTLKAEVGFKWFDKGKYEEAVQRKIKALPLYFALDTKKDEVLRGAIRNFMDAVRRKNIPAGELRKETAGEEELPKALETFLDTLSERELVEIGALHAWQDTLEKHLAQGIISLERKNTFPWGKEASVTGRNGRVYRLPARALETPREMLETVFLAGLRHVPTAPEQRKILAKKLARAFAEAWKEGNLGENGSEEKLAREAARKSVKEKDFLVSVRKDEVLFRENEEIQPADAERYQAYLAARDKENLFAKNVLSHLCQMIMLLFVITLCIWSTRKELLKSNGTLSLLVLLAVTAVLLNKYAVSVFVSLADSYDAVTPVMIYFSLPIGFGVILVSAFFGTRMALFSGFFISVVASMHLPEPYKVMFAGCFITSVAALSVRGATNYREFFTRSFVGCTIAAFSVSIAYFLKDENHLLTMAMEGLPRGLASVKKDWILQFLGLILLPIGTGLFSAVAGLVSLFLLELLFDIASPMYLQLYSDLNYPLMRRLQLEAPGTYHHSLMVSAIAEQAARAIGADHVLARVCALYHDIGKLAQPLYFVENSGGVNMHAEVAPSMSAMIILNHVKYGLELAAKHKLKKPLREAIAQHHGDGLIVYFYKLAEAEAKRENQSVDASDYRYPGPKPESRENGILMLADCCEAASRSLKDASPEAVEQLVSSIIAGKIKDGQLEASFLSMRELRAIRESITNTLISMSHIRISYPKENKEGKNEDDLFVAAGKNDLPKA
ncbi:MAG: HDIG domain-containing protein [Lentisphaeria bacterium]|nr:HDIG domain-containing protein [Lentisphaeria bacterium]